MSWVAVAVVGGTVASGYLSSQAQKSAAKDASRAQIESSDAAIAEQRRQFDAIQELLAPYVQAGETALTSQMALIGLAGPEAQQQAIQQLEQSPQFEALTQQGENALLQNASATGGLRGGNTQQALAEYRPSVLSNLIQQQYQNLGGITSIGQASAVQQANIGQQTGVNVGNLLQQQGSARAGDYLARGQAQSNFYNSIPQAFTLGGVLGGKF